MKILHTENPSFGFYGTVQTAGWNPDAAWNIASRQIAEIFERDVHETDLAIAIRDFLDSRLGRHFADEAITLSLSACRMTGTGCQKVAREQAIRITIARHMNRTINAKIERDEGIPRGLPFLTGWLHHFAIAAQETEA